MVNHAQIIQFWNWFASNADRIRAAYRQAEHKWLDQAISHRVKRLGKGLNWELGPYHAPDDTFVLSPTVRENLAVTRATVAAAPELKGWHFSHAKPPKQLLSLTFSAHGQTIIADDWRYCLTAYNNGEFVDIEIFANASSSLTESHQDLFCELVVEALIGEECRLDRVGYLVPKIVSDNSKIKRSSSIQHLNDHLSQVLRPIDREA